METLSMFSNKAVVARVLELLVGKVDRPPMDKWAMVLIAECLSQDSSILNIYYTLFMQLLQVKSMDMGSRDGTSCER